MWLLAGVVTVCSWYLLASWVLFKIVVVCFDYEFGLFVIAACLRFVVTLYVWIALLRCVGL